MQLGFAVPTTGAWGTPDNMVAFAQRAEELGYSSLWTFQRLLFPAEAGEGNPRWQPVYESVHDPLVTLGFLAAHTNRARLGVAVVNMPWYSPILLAKMVTTLDHLSGGRIDLGLGLGWSELEYAAAGAPLRRRGARADEFIACIKAVWTEDPVEFTGEDYVIEAAHVRPPPLQQPHPPILLGGGAKPALQRAGRLCDGWVSSSGMNLADIGASIGVIRDAAREAGRDPDVLRFVSRGVVRWREGGVDGERRPLMGTFEQIRADLEAIAAQGVTELFVDLNFDDEVGSPDCDPHESVRRGYAVLEALAP